MVGTRHPASGNPALAPADFRRASFDKHPAGTIAKPSLSFESLHAHWRMAYIAAPRYPQSAKPFSDLPALGDDRAALIVHRSSRCYLLLNRYPYNPGHLLAIPFREVTDLDELTAEESADLMAIMVLGRRLLQRALRPDGINLGFNLGSAAGGSIAHLHGHLVPRWQGDCNFMPVLGNTRILPESLDTTWAKLTATIPDLEQP
jgi:ATP adenylyltransferase